MNKLKQEFDKLSDYKYNVSWNDKVEIAYLKDYIYFLEKKIEALSQHDVSGSLPIKKYDIDLGGNAMVGIEIKGESLKIFGAMDKRGDGIDYERIKITERGQ